MTLLILGLFLFLGAHSLPMAPGLRGRLIARLGDNGYRGLMAVASLAGLVLIVWGYGAARYDPVILWHPPFWTAHISWSLMAIAFVLIVAAYIPGKIGEKVRHPMLAGVKIWAFAHLIANGTLADVVLFGSILAWAVIDRISLKKRERAGLVTITGGPVRNDVIAIVVGLAAYAVFLLYLHRWLIGVSPVA
jgi:uncharacterized membrane protein